MGIDGRIAVARMAEASGTQQQGEFLSAAERTLRRALVARYGLEVGRDAAGDAVLWAVENWERLVTMTNPLGYLFRVGQSSARRQGRWKRPEVLVPRSSDEVVVDVDLQRMLLRLRPPERVAVLLVHGFGYRYSEVAEVLDVPVTTVTNHVNRGLNRLRALMEHP